LEVFNQKSNPIANEVLTEWVEIEQISVNVQSLNVKIEELDEDIQKGKIVKENIKPFIKTHILISFPPEKMIEIQDYIQKITEIEGIEYEQSSN